MNREIEFNAWLPELGYMLKDVTYGHGQIGFPSDDEDLYQHLKSKGYNPDEYELPEWLSDTGEDWYYINGNEHFILLQYIGLKDIDEVKIFDGDGVSIENKTLGEIILTVEQYETGFEFKQRWMGARLFEAAQNCKVIGNIYENPELLKIS